MEALSQFLNLKDGVSGLLASLCVILSLSLLTRVGEFLWRIKEKKEMASDASIKELTDVVRDNTTATEHLEHRLTALEQSLMELPKVKSKLQKLFAAIKHMAGDEWHKIRGMIEDEGEL